MKMDKVAGSGKSKDNSNKYYDCKNCKFKFKGELKDEK